MSVALPSLVTQRETHWRGYNSAPLKLQQEMSDWVWEKWNAGQLDVTLPLPLKRDMVELKQVKDTVFPSTSGKLSEEFEEVIEARGFGIKDAIDRGLEAISQKKAFNKQDWERLTYGLNMPDVPIEQYLQYAVLKLQGRVATNIANPKAKSEELKDALVNYEESAAKRVFEATA